MNKLSIIIPFYNSETSLKRCVDSILSQKTKHVIEIIAVDDGSTDRSKEIINSFNNQSINLLSYSENRGIAFARNHGAQYATSDLIAFVDSDMVLSSDWVELGLEYMDNSSIMGIMGQYIAPDDVKQNSLDIYLYSNIRGAKAHYKGRTPISFKYFLFSNTIIRKSVFEEVGTFDDSFTRYGGEDTDLSIRIYKLYPQGLYYYPDMITLHYGQKSLAQFCSNMYNFGKYNLSKIIKQYPEFEKELQIFWLKSIWGYLVFNPVIHKVVDWMLRWCKILYLLRYKVIYSTVCGYRDRNIVD